MLHNKLSLILVIACGFFLTACASQQFSSAYNSCGPDAYAKFPIQNQQQSVKKSREVQVSTGRVNCSSSNGWGGVKTNCTEQYVPKTEYYTEIETVDVNAGPRRNYQNACAMQKCLRQHSQEQCKSGLNVALPGKLGRIQNMLQ